MSSVVVIAPDSFKESLDAPGVAAALASGIVDALPDAIVRCVPMADGGEGTTVALASALGGRLVDVLVHGPLGEPTVASLGLLPDGEAVTEMASASGLMLVPPNRRNPALTSTFGTGELVRHALDRGVTRLILGIGGSATNDGGAGFARALGVRFLDAHGVDLPEGGAALARLDRIDTTGLDPRLAALTLDVACDVDNPLCGARGASAVYGPQKGASPALVAELDAALGRFAEVVARDLGRAVADLPGAGAAGGLGAGLLAFTDARLRPGIDIVMEASGLASAIEGADLVVTGEGRLDAQTRYGKAPAGVAGLARAWGRPIVAVGGSVGEGAGALVPDVFDAIVVATPPGTAVPDAFAQAAVNLRQAGRDIAQQFLTR